MRLPVRGARERLRQAQARGYIVAKMGDVGPWLRHWDACRQAQRPYIRVIQRRLYADIEVDMQPAGWRLSDSQVTDVALILIRYGTRRSLRDWTERILFISRVPLTQVQNLLTELLCFLLRCEICRAIKQEHGNLAVWIISTKGLGH